MIFKKTKDLKPSRHIQKLYGDFSLAREEDELLYLSICEKGILQPLIISKKNEIISGYRRYHIALMRGINEVPVIVEDVSVVSELMVITHNLQRVKNVVQWTYEYEMLRKTLGSKQGVKNLTEETKKTLGDAKETVNTKVKESTRKRINGAVKLMLELNSELSVEGAWKQVSEKIEMGDNPTSLLNKLEKDKASKNNKKSSSDFEDFEIDEFKIINSDSAEAFKQIKSRTIQNLTTSPPYWNFRNYDGREKAKTSYPLGEEPTPMEYIKNLGDIISSYKSAMKDGGSVFVNVMDKNFKNSPSNIPFELANYLKKRGFHYRQPIYWFKRNPPFSGNNQLAQPSMEHILHFTVGVNEDYFWNENAFNDEEFNLIHEALYGGQGKRKLLRNLIIPPSNVQEEGGNVLPGLIETNVYSPHHLNKLLQEQGFVLTHNALYDYEIPMLLILPTTKEKDTCLDIFNGLGTTGLVAYATKRSYIGVELSKLYAVQTKARFKSLFLKEKKELIQESIPKKTEVLKKKPTSKKL